MNRRRRRGAALVAMSTLVVMLVPSPAHAMRVRAAWAPYVETYSYARCDGTTLTCSARADDDQWAGTLGIELEVDSGLDGRLVGPAGIAQGEAAVVAGFSDLSGDGPLEVEAEVLVRGSTVSSATVGAADASAIMFMTVRNGGVEHREEWPLPTGGESSVDLQMTIDGDIGDFVTVTVGMEGVASVTDGVPTTAHEDLVAGLARSEATMEVVIIWARAPNQS